LGGTRGPVGHSRRAMRERTPSSVTWLPAKLRRRERAGRGNGRGDGGRRCREVLMVVIFKT